MMNIQKKHKIIQHQSDVIKESCVKRENNVHDMLQKQYPKFIKKKLHDGY